MDQHSKFADLEINGAKTKRTTFRCDIKLSVTTESGVTPPLFFFFFFYLNLLKKRKKNPFLKKPPPNDKKNTTQPKKKKKKRTPTQKQPFSPPPLRYVAAKVTRDGRGEVPEWDGAAPVAKVTGGAVEYSVTKQSQGCGDGIIGS
ncbi:hypothetical protein LSAT2_026190 [Lamellibrachia satsuma]|nr:hypothetical protein LSAT2_026190 [Lamellibrachia satsuma]